ncbi:MAG: hypothetical protein WBA54_05295, partial [Acidaminobacteraceae bacterium]
MKVSGQALTQVNKEIIKPSVDDKKAETRPLKDGEKYKGKLTSIDGAKVKVNINGKEYSATVNSGSLSDKVVGDQIEFKVTVNGSEVLIDIKSEGTSISTKGLDNLIMNLGLSKSDENKAIITLLKEFKIPITKENFEEIKSFVKSKELMISMLNKNIESGSTILDLSKVINKDLSLKENLINILKSEANDTNLQIAKSSSNIETIDLITQSTTAPSNLVSLEGNANVSNEVTSGKMGESIEIKLVDENSVMSAVRLDDNEKESSNTIKVLVNKSEKNEAVEIIKMNIKSELAEKEVLN